MLTIVLLLSAIGVSLSSLDVHAQEYPQGRFYLIPSNNQYPSSTTPGTRFNVTFYAYNLTTEQGPPPTSYPGGVFNYQFRVYCDSTMLNITGAWRGEWLTNWIFYGRTSVGTNPSIDKDANGYFALVADSLLVGGAINVTTDVILGIVEFNITRQPPDGALQCALNITNALTYWAGPSPATKHFPVRENGSYIIPEMSSFALILALLVATTSGLASTRIVRLKKHKEST